MKEDCTFKQYSAYEIKSVVIEQTRSFRAIMKAITIGNQLSKQKIIAIIPQIELVICESAAIFKF